MAAAVSVREARRSALRRTNRQICHPTLRSPTRRSSPRRPPPCPSPASGGGAGWVTFEQRSAWGSAFGGSNTTSGDAAAGSSTVTASTYGFAAGMDYHVSPYTVVGFALAGAGTNWGLANAFGNGRS